MAVTALTPVTVSRTVTDGVNLAAALTAVAGPIATDQNSFANDGTTLLRVKNGGGSAVTVTVFFQGTTAPSIDGMALATDKGRTYSVPATTGDRLIGPFPTAQYGTNVIVGFSATASVTAAAYQPV